MRRSSRAPTPNAPFDPAVDGLSDKNRLEATAADLGGTWPAAKVTPSAGNVPAQASDDVTHATEASEPPKQEGVSQRAAGVEERPSKHKCESKQASKGSGASAVCPSIGCTAPENRAPKIDELKHMVHFFLAQLRWEHKKCISPTDSFAEFDAYLASIECDLDLIGVWW